MKPELKRIEIKPMCSGNHDLAIEHAIGRQIVEQRLPQLGKVAVKRAQIPALNVEVGLMSKDDRAKPVPLRLVKKATSLGQRLRQFRQHRLDWRSDRERRRCLRLVHGNGCIKDEEAFVTVSSPPSIVVATSAP